MPFFSLRFVAFLLVSAFLPPVLSGCGKTQKAMENPSGLSARQQRDQKQGRGAGQ